MGGADHRPFAFYLVDAAKQELAEIPGLLDVSEDRFDDVFSHPVATSMATLAEPGAHGLDQFAALGAAIRCARTAGGHVATHGAGNQAFEVGL